MLDIVVEPTGFATSGEAGRAGFLDDKIMPEAVGGESHALIAHAGISGWGRCGDRGNASSDTWRRPNGSPTLDARELCPLAPATARCRGTTRWV